MDKINVLRTKIDHIDQQLMDLLEERYTLTNAIGLVKENIQKNVKDNDRELYIFNKITKYSHSPSIELVYKAIINESKNQQGK